MRYKQIVLSVGVISLMLLGGCSGVIKEQSSGKTDSTSTEKRLPEEFVLYSDTRFTEGGIRSEYIFSGFPDDDRFLLQARQYEEYVEIYLPAEVGFKFRLTKMKNREFEVLEVNRKENYLKLKTTAVQ